MAFSTFNVPSANTNHSNTVHNPNNDVILSDPPSDSIQAIKWSPNANLLACSSWDCTVRTYSIDSQTGSSSKIGQYHNDGPALDLCWSHDAANIISAGCDKLIKVWNPNQSVPSVVGYHDKPIRKIAFCCDATNSLSSAQIISGGWDKELRFWDAKQCVSYTSSHSSDGLGANSIYASQLKPVGSVSMAERVYAMDLKYPILCVALANKKVMVFDVRNTAKPVKEMITLLKHQLRCIAMFPDRKGFAVGSVEGRCAIHYIQEGAEQNAANFAFKCHRRKQNVYAVNALRFHDKFGTFSSAGGDGTVYFWDKDQKSKLKQFEAMQLPVTDVDFSYDGQLFAYAISYDWSKGIEHFQPKQQKPEIFIHKLAPKEIQPKADT